MSTRARCLTLASAVMTTLTLGACGSQTPADQRSEVGTGGSASEQASAGSSASAGPTAAASPTDAESFAAAAKALPGVVHADFYDIDGLRGSVTFGDVDPASLRALFDMWEADGAASSVPDSDHLIVTDPDGAMERDGFETQIEGHPDIPDATADAVTNLLAQVDGVRLFLYADGDVQLDTEISVEAGTAWLGELQSALDAGAAAAALIGPEAEEGAVLVGLPALWPPRIPYAVAGQLTDPGWQGVIEQIVDMEAIVDEDAGLSSPDGCRVNGNPPVPSVVCSYPNLGGVLTPEIQAAQDSLQAAVEAIGVPFIVE